MADAKLEIILNARDQTRGAFSSVNHELGSLSSNAGKVGGALGGMAVGVAKVAAVVGGGLAAGLGAAVKSASDFESALSEIKAVSGATGAEMGQLRSLALQMGKDTSFSAKEAAQGISELAKAGVSTADIMGGALEGSLALAAAGGVSVGRAAEVAAQAMNIFGLAGKDVAHVADLFSAGANKSATSVDELAAAFNQSAAVAKISGISIEELTGALSMFAQSGLQGSDAGTSLKTALIALQNPSDKARALMGELGINAFDAQGKFVGLAGLADQLKAALSGMSQEQRNAALATIFGSDAIRVAAILYEKGGEGVREWTAAVNDSGAAQRNATTRLDNLAGAFEQLKGSLETAAITIGSAFLPVLRRATDEVTKLVNAFLESPEAQKAIQDLAANAERALNTIITKLKDPAFQAEMKEWARTARDVGRAILDLAGDIKDTLGPPLKAAATWFSSLDEDGRKNVVMFGLVAGAAVGFRKELGTLLTVGRDVVDMFAAKLAAKKALTAANEKLAGSAGNTGKALATVRTAATGAAVALAEGAVVTVGAVGAWAGIIAAADKYNDVSGTTARNERELITTRQALAIAAEHGASAESEHALAFLRLYQAQSQNITTTDQLVALWNQYVATGARAVGGTEGLTVATARAAASQGALNDRLGEGAIAGAAFNRNIGLLGGAAAMLGTTIDTATAAQDRYATGMGAGATAAAALVAPLRATNEALAGLGTRFAEQGAAMQGMTNAASPLQAALDLLNQKVAAGLPLTAEQQHLLSTLPGYLAGATSGYDGLVLAQAQTAIAMANTNRAASGTGGAFGGAAGEASRLRARVDELAGATRALQSAFGALGQENSKLSGYYGVLNERLQVLNEQKKRGKGLSAEEAAEADTLQAALDKLGGAMGGNAAKQREYVLALLGLGDQTKIATGQANDFNTAMGQLANPPEARDGLVGLTDGFGNVATASESAKKKVDDVTTAVNNAPKTLPVAVSAPGANEAAIAIQNVGTQVNNVPKSFTVTAHVDISSALASIGTLNNNLPHSPAKEGPLSELPNWAALFVELPAEAAKAGADAAKSVADAIQALLGATKAVANFDFAADSPTGDDLGWFRHLTESLIATMAEAASAFEAEAMEHTGKFADAVGKVGNAVKSAVEGLTLLGKTNWADASPTGDAMGWFMHLVSSLVQNFADAGANFEEDGLKGAERFADAVGKVTGVISGAVAGLEALKKFSAPTEAKVAAFMRSLGDLMERFGTWASGFEEDSLAASARFAEAAGKVVGILDNGVKGLMALRDFAAPAEAQVAAFMVALGDTMERFGTWAGNFEQDVLDSTTRFADAAGKVAGVIGPAVEGFAKLATFSAPSETAIDQLAEGIKAIVRKFAAMATMLDAEGTKATSDFADAAGKALGAAKTGIELFAAMAGDKDKAGNHVPVGIPSATAIDQLAEGIKYVVRKFAEMARGMENEGIKEMQAFADAAGKVLAAAKTGTDLFKDMEKLAVPAKEAIDYLLGSIGYVITQARAIATGIGTEGMAQAQAFATGALNVVGTIKQALELFPELAKLKALPEDALWAIFNALEHALQATKSNVNRATDILNEANKFRDTMRDAALAMAEGLAFGASIPAASALAPAGVGGGGSAETAAAGGGTTVNVTLAGNQYGFQDFNDAVVSAVEQGTRQGRIA